ncbi:MAG: recombination mediator RecR [Trichlorobacter sp.]|jgi:recombination protein RecR|nr:recombination mediator RecR [Trichlorobacter sp.]
MVHNAPVLNRLVGELKKLPGIGERTALRLTFHMLKSPHSLNQLAEALLDVREHVRSCSTCFALTEQDPCQHCSGNRDNSIVCVVETTQDLMALERSNAYLGSYHVLQGAISPLKGVNPADLKIDELLARVARGGIEEVVIATNFSVEGETTALYLARQLKPLGVKVTRLAHGIPLGSDIEYVDPATVQWALAGRNEV